MIPVYVRGLVARSVALLVSSGTALAAQDVPREQWQRSDSVIHSLALAPGGRVADVGAGEGFYTRLLSKVVGAGGRVYAVDITDFAISSLHKLLERDTLTNVSVIKGDPDNPQLPTDSPAAILRANAYHQFT